MLKVLQYEKPQWSPVWEPLYSNGAYWAYAWKSPVSNLYWTTLSIKNVFLMAKQNCLYCSLYQFHLVLLLKAVENKLVPSSIWQPFRLKSTIKSLAALSSPGFYAKFPQAFHTALVLQSLGQKTGWREARGWTGFGGDCGRGCLSSWHKFKCTHWGSQ